MVVIIFALMVALTVIIGAVGLLIAKSHNPSVDIKEASAFLGNVVTTIVGALVGFIGGRAAGRAEVNGNIKYSTEENI